MSGDGYTRVSIPTELLEEIKRKLKDQPRGFSTPTEFIKDAIRKSLYVQDISKDDILLIEEYRKQHSKA